MLKHLKAKIRARIPNMRARINQAITAGPGEAFLSLSSNTYGADYVLGALEVFAYTNIAVLALKDTLSPCPKDQQYLS